MFHWSGKPCLLGRLIRILTWDTASVERKCLCTCYVVMASRRDLSGRKLAARIKVPMHLSWFGFPRMARMITTNVSREIGEDE